MELETIPNSNETAEEAFPLRKNVRDIFVQFVKSETFSARAANVLLKNCFSLEEFISLTERELFSFPNCGRKTALEILRFLAENCSGDEFKPPPSLEEQLTALPQKSSIDLLPLFSSKHLPGFTSEQLHPGFHGNLKNKDLALSVRATGILEKMHLDTIGEVMLTPASALLKQKNFGTKCLWELQDAVREVCNNGVQQEKLVLPPTEHSLPSLPLYSNQRFRGMTVADLHQNFRALTRLSDLIISSRTSKVLTDLGMATIGEVMLFPGNELLRAKNFGHKSLKELREIVRDLCLSERKENGELIDLSSYQAMVKHFVSRCIKRHRDQMLFVQRFCFVEGSQPTLEELGQEFGITRERVRQILKKGLNKLRIKANSDKLRSFWQQLDNLVVQGGGLIRLGRLSTVLQAHYKWPSPPFPPALGQLLLLKEPGAVLKQANDIWEVPCSCLSCKLPGEQLQKLDFETTESFHIQVVASRLCDDCRNRCHTGKPITTFYRAFIERLIENDDCHLMLHSDLLLPYERWRERYCGKLEEVTCQVLASHGKPMHFRDIANAVRQVNVNFDNLTDNNIHAAVMRYDSIEIINRGVYGLKKWGLGGYRSVSSAIEQLIDERGLPQRKRDIVTALGQEFSEQNINASITVATRFTNIGESFYDRPQNWRQRTCKNLITLLPDSVADFAVYLVNRNNTSYRLVMALIFIRSMDEDGDIYLYKLKEMFYNFYRSRHKKRLVVERDSTVMSRIAYLSPTEIKNRACKKTLDSFLESGFFQIDSQNGTRLQLAGYLVSELLHVKTRDIMLITILKAIDDYFLALPPALALAISPLPPKVVDHDDISKHHESKAGPQEETLPPISIRKKRRGKIKL